MKNVLLFILLISNSLVGFSQYTWEQVALPDSIGAGSICFYENDIYLATGNGVYYSNDNCESWEYIGLEQYPIWSIYVSTTGNLYAGTGWRFFKYAGDKQWDLLYEPADATNILSIYESDSGYIFFGNFGSIYRSIDGGITWTEVLDLLNTESVESITGNNEGILYAGTISFSGDVSPGGVYKSEDGGASWNLVGLDYHFVSSVVVNSDDEIFVGTNGHWYTGSGRIYKSTNDGETWDIVFDNHYVLSLSINEYNEVAAASETGIFCNYDGGVAWENFTPSDTVVNFKRVAFNLQDHLYTISYFADLFRTTEPVFVKRNFNINVQFEISLYPNPSDNVILLSSENYQCDEIFITDFLGRYIKNVQPRINNNRTEINISDLPPSVYLIHCISDHNIRTAKFIKY